MLPRGKTFAEDNQIDKKDKIKTDKTSKIIVKQNKLNRFTPMVCNNVQSGRIAAEFAETKNAELLKLRLKPT